MRTERRFLVAPSLARLIQRERGIAGRAVVGYFSSQSQRSLFVAVEAATGHLVLFDTTPEGAHREERVEIPRAHAEALLQACAGTIAYNRIRVPAHHGPEVLLDRIIRPGAFDLLTVEFDDTGRAQEFIPPAWFGPEVTHEWSYARHSIAVKGPPRAEVVPLSAEALDAFLDAIEETEVQTSPEQIADEVLRTAARSDAALDAEELRAGMNSDENGTPEVDSLAESGDDPVLNGMMASLAQVLEATIPAAERGTATTNPPTQGAKGSAQPTRGPLRRAWANRERP